MPFQCEGGEGIMGIAHMQLVDQSNPHKLQQTSEWTFLKVHNLLKKIWSQKNSSADVEVKGGPMDKKWNFEAEKNLKCQFYQLLFILTYFQQENGCET